MNATQDIDQIINGLSPAMKQALLNHARSAGVAGFETGRNTEQALAARGLAEERYGIKEVPARYTGVYGRTTTIYDGYLGIHITELGSAVAARLLEAEGSR